MASDIAPGGPADPGSAGPRAFRDMTLTRPGSRSRELGRLLTKRAELRLNRVNDVVLLNGNREGLDAIRTFHQLTA